MTKLSTAQDFALCSAEQIDADLTQAMRDAGIVAPAPTFTREQREAAWGWDPTWGEQQPDQHVREWLMSQDDLVAEQLAGLAAVEAFYAAAEAEIVHTRAAYLANPTDATFEAYQYAQLALA